MPVAENDAILSDEDGGMSFWGHLEALRWTLFRMLIAIVVCVIVSFVAMPYVFDNFILAPTGPDFFLYRFFAKMGDRLPFLPDFGNSSFSVDIININVASQFMTHISTSFWMALVLAFPYIIYEIWKFVRPALFPKEIRNMRMAFVFGTGMFYLGCAVGYCIVFPFTFRFLVEYQISEHIVNQINLNSYINNFLMMIFVMGIVFELPLLAWLLSKLGIIDREFLVTYRKYAVVVLLVLAAIITPSGDPFTLAVVFLPLYFLYELSVRLVSPRKSVENDDDE
ncbi:MAG: twin-arginine translocase subunit TatC [Bacteroides sp.]|nr:twin-arginine translocase subunit TatC [Bacteroides sp.]